MNKIDEIKCYVKEMQPHVLMITETWAGDKIQDVELKLEGYETFRNDRKHARGGGCLIYCNSTINSTLDLELTNTEALKLYG